MVDENPEAVEVMRRRLPEATTYVDADGRPAVGGTRSGSSDVK
jgi:hypothetical protein